MTEADRTGSVAPAFDLPLLDGGRAGSADWVDQGGVLVLFKTDCPTSGLVLPELGGLARSLEREGRRFLAIAQDPEPLTLEFRDRHGLEFPIAIESPPYPVSRAYGVEVVPTLVVVSVAGRIAARLEGFLKSEYLGVASAMARALGLRFEPPVLDHPDLLPALKPG